MKNEKKKKKMGEKKRRNKMSGRKRQRIVSLMLKSEQQKITKQAGFVVYKRKDEEKNLTFRGQAAEFEQRISHFHLRHSLCSSPVLVVCFAAALPKIIIIIKSMEYEFLPSSHGQVDPYSELHLRA